jgi:hypothetical protein
MEDAVDRYTKQCIGTPPLFLGIAGSWGGEFVRDPQARLRLDIDFTMDKDRYRGGFVLKPKDCLPGLD